MNRLAELLARLADFATLPDTELATLRTQIEEAIADAGEGQLTAEVTQLMAEADAQVEAIEAEQTLRAETAAKIRADADAVLEKQKARKTKAEGGEPTEPEAKPDEAAPEAPKADAGGAGDGGADGGDTTTTGDAGEGGDSAGDGDAGGGESAPQAVAAGQRPDMVRDVVVPPRNAPRVTTQNPVIIASGEVRGVVPGHVFASIDDLTEKMFDRWNTMRTSADGQMHYMGTIDYREMYPPELQLRSADPMEVSDQVMREVRRRTEAQMALRHEHGADGYKSMVASGGIPGPSEPRYQQITYGQARRPLRDALPGFLANRGSIIFNESPTLADIVLDQSGGAIGTITNTQDIAGTAKTIQEISAPTATTVTVEAEVLRFSQGNFADRFYPERTRAFMALGQVAFARHNEALRLNDIKNGSVKWTDTPAKFGAYRDLKRTFFAVLEEIEDLVRDFEQNFTVLMPEFVPALIASDLIAQGFGDDGWKATVGAVKADMQSWAPNATMTFLYDSIRGRLSTTPSGQSPRTPGYDTDVEWCIFPTGTWLYLDGGQLDLGIIRDSATSQLNKFQTFFEQWEAVARIAPLSFWITNSLCANGLAQIPATVATGCEGGS